METAIAIRNFGSERSGKLAKGMEYESGYHCKENLGTT